MKRDKPCSSAIFDQSYGHCDAGNTLVQHENGGYDELVFCYHGGAAPAAPKQGIGLFYNNNQISLKGGNWHRYCSDEGNVIKCNRNSVQGWEKFTVVQNGGNFALKGGNWHRYCSDEGNTVKCNRNAIQGWERFTVQDMGGQVVALKGGKWHRWCSDEGNNIKCNRDHIHGWEKFTVGQA
jgi:hypothetical protein